MSLTLRAVLRLTLCVAAVALLGSCGRFKFQALQEDAGFDAVGTADAAIDAALPRDSGGDSAEDGASGDAVVDAFMDASVEPSLVDVSLGAYHSCFLFSNGRVYCRGRNDSGQLGLGHSESPSAGWMMNIEDASSVSLGGYHTLVERLAGELWATGADYYGQVGDGAPRQQQSQLVRLATSGPVSQFYAWRWGGCASDDESLRCWGSNESFQLGTGAKSGTVCSVPGGDTDCELAPVPVQASVASLTRTDIGASHGCGIGDREVLCWGFNNAGQVGVDPSTGTLVGAVVAQGLPDADFEQVSIGLGHSCVVTVGGDGYCWGNNRTGALGDGSTSSRHTAARLTINNIDSIAAMGAMVGSEVLSATCVVNSQGLLFCWGDNSDDQVGINGALDAYVTPQQVPSPPFVRVVAGGRHFCALTADKDVYCWGDNAYGQIDDSGEPRVAAPRLLALPSP